MKTVFTSILHLAAAALMPATLLADIPALTPSPRSRGEAAWWKALSEADAQVKGGGSKVVFLGDDFFRPAGLRIFFR